MEEDAEASRERRMKETIEKAKMAVVKKYEHMETTKRKWLEASAPDSYSNPEYRMTLLVLEGSPPKGFVVVNHPRRKAIAFDAFCNRIRTYTADHNEAV